MWLHENWGYFCGTKLWFIRFDFIFFGPHIYQKVMDTKIDLKKKKVGS